MILKLLWCICRTVRNERTNDDVTALVRRCMWLIENCPHAVVEIDYHYITITTSTSTIKLWNANKFYAWISSGTVNGRGFSGCMPSREVSYEFMVFLKKRGHNIFQKEAQKSISVSDVKC